MEDLKEVLQMDAEEEVALSEPENEDEAFKERRYGIMLKETYGIMLKETLKFKIIWKKKKQKTPKAEGWVLLSSPGLEVMGRRSES